MWHLPDIGFTDPDDRSLVAQLYSHGAPSPAITARASSRCPGCNRGRRCAMTIQLRNKAAIVGIGDSDIGKVPHMTGLGLNAQAARRALDDAGLQVGDIDGLLTAYSFSEPYFMLGTVLCEYLGLKPRFCSAMIAGGASPAVMLGHAAAAVATGMA